MSNYFILREKDKAKSFKETIVSDGASSDTGRHKAQLEITIDSKDPDYNEEIIGDNILDVIVLDAELPDNFIDDIEATLAGVESLVTSIDIPLTGNLKTQSLSETFDISNNLRDAYENSPNTSMTTMGDAFENAHEKNNPRSLNAGDIRSASKSYKSNTKVTTRPFNIILNEHVDKLTVQGLDLGGKGKNLLMNPLGLRFGNPNDADDSIEITTDVRVQPESKQVDNKIIFSNDEFVVPLNRNDRIRLTQLIRRVRAGEQRSIEVDKAGAGSLITTDKGSLRNTIQAAIESWDQDRPVTIVNRPTSEWDMDQGFSVTSRVTTSDTGQVVLNANVVWRAKQQIAALPLDFTHNEGGGSQGGMTFASKSDLGIDTFLNLQISLDLNFPIADINPRSSNTCPADPTSDLPNDTPPPAAGTEGPKPGTGTGGMHLGPVDQTSNSSERSIPTSREIRKFKNAKSRQIESLIKHYSKQNDPQYMVPAGVMNALRSLQNVAQQGWINTNNSGLKFSITSEPTGSFLASFNGATLQLKTYLAEQTLC